MIISIALASLNGEKHIKAQLESVAEQTILPDELIICDDGSTDGTIEIVLAFMSIAPFKVSLFQNENNLGYVQNFSKALSLCHGDIVFLSDQDDVWFPEKIETVIKVFEQDQKAWILIHDGNLTDANLLPSGQTKMSQILRGYGRAEDTSTGALSAVRQDLLKYALPIPSGIPAHDAWLHRIASLIPARRVVMKQSLQYIRRHQKNTSSWVINSDKKVSRRDVFFSHVKSNPALDYMDRLAINTGVNCSFLKMKEEFTDHSDLHVLEHAAVYLEKERKAIYSRQTLVECGWFLRKLYSVGTPPIFNGVHL